MEKAFTSGIYAGSFDPPTLGHLWVIEQGLRLFDRFTVLVGTNPKKTPMFTAQERVDLIRLAFAEYAGKTRRFSVTFLPQEDYLSDYAATCGATHLLRGIRNSTDLEYERGLQSFNSDRQPDISTIYLMPPQSLAEVSSSFAKGIIGPAGWEEALKNYVPEHILEAIIDKRSSDG